MIAYVNGKRVATRDEAIEAGRQAVLTAADALRATEDKDLQFALVWRLAYQALRDMEEFRELGKMPKPGRIVEVLG